MAAEGADALAQASAPLFGPILVAQAEELVRGGRR